MQGGLFEGVLRTAGHLRVEHGFLVTPEGPHRVDLAVRVREVGALARGVRFVDHRAHQVPVRFFQFVETSSETCRQLVFLFRPVAEGPGRVPDGVGVAERVRGLPGGRSEHRPLRWPRAAGGKKTHDVQQGKSHETRILLRGTHASQPGASPGQSGMLIDDDSARRSRLAEWCS